MTFTSRRTLVDLASRHPDAQRVCPALDPRAEDDCPTVERPQAARLCPNPAHFAISTAVGVAPIRSFCYPRRMTVWPTILPLAAGGPHDLPLISTIAGAFTAAWILGLITQKLRLSPIVGYILAGVAIGPFTPGFRGDVGLAHQLAEVGVILLMFGVGLHF